MKKWEWGELPDGAIGYPREVLEEELIKFHKDFLKNVEKIKKVILRNPNFQKDLKKLIKDGIIRYERN